MATRNRLKPRRAACRVGKKAGGRRAERDGIAEASKQLIEIGGDRATARQARTPHRASSPTTMRAPTGGELCQRSKLICRKKFRGFNMGLSTPTSYIEIM